MKIYVITEGEYSDYRIITATTDLNLAEAIGKKFNAMIEEYENAELKLRPLWLVRFEKNGDVCECRLVTSSYDYEQAGLCGVDVRGRVYTHIIADSAEGAIKAGAERRAKFLAERLM